MEDHIDFVTIFGDDFDNVQFLYSRPSLHPSGPIVESVIEPVVPDSALKQLGPDTGKFLYSSFSSYSSSSPASPFEQLLGSPFGSPASPGLTADSPTVPTAIQSHLTDGQAKFHDA